MFIKHLLLILSALSLAIAQTCIPGGCDCSCNCNGGTPGGNPGTPTIAPTLPPGTTMCPMCNMTGGGGGGGGGGGNMGDQCDQMILSASATFTNIGSILGELLRALLSQLVMPILMIVLAGNNTVQGAVIPLAGILCYIVGLILLLLQNIGALGLLGPGGLLQNLLGALTGGLGG